MAMTKGSKFSPTDFKNLKARVKAEMARRNGYGSLVTYAGTSYDYSTVPKKDEPIKAEHYNKIRDLMANINSITVTSPSKKADETVPPMDILQAQMTTFESRPRGERITNDCASACTGTCISACTTACIGCSGCTGCDGCSGCGSGCATSCSGCSGCDSTCMGDCSNSSC